MPTPDEEDRQSILEQLRLLREGAERVPMDDPPLAAKFHELVQASWLSWSPPQRVEVETEYNAVFGKWGQGGPAAAATPAQKRPPFDSLVVDGWFRRYLDYCSVGKSTPQFYFGAAMAFIAAGLGRAPRIEWEAIPLYPNCYILLVGGTGSGKSTAIGLAQSVIQPAMGAWLLPNEGSHAGFAEHLKRRWDQTGIAADGLIVADEFSTLISAEKHKSELVVWLTDWYQKDGWWERALRGEQETYRFKNPCVSLIAGSNMPWLRKLPTDAVLGGFFPRFFLFNTPIEEEQWGVAMPRFDKVSLKGLQEQLERLVHHVPEEVSFSDEALEWINGWYDKDLRREKDSAPDDQMQAWLMRKQAALMKLATIWQLVDRGPCDVIELEWLKKARGVVDWCDATVEQVYQGLGQTRAGEIVVDVMAAVSYIQDRDGGSAREASVARRLRAKHMAKDVYAMMRELYRQGDLMLVESGAGGVRWRVVK